MNAKEKIECLCGDFIASLVKPLEKAVLGAEEDKEVLKIVVS